MSKERDKYIVLYGSLVVLLEDDDDDMLLEDEFDEVLAHTMLLEMNRRSL